MLAANSTVLVLHLQDDPTVKEYPKVQGMVHDVYFWSHDHPEGGRDESSSKQNGKEAAMAARLAFYLVQQGYDGGDITIITPYVGQLLLLRTEIKKYMRFVVSDKDAEQLAALQVALLLCDHRVRLCLQMRPVLP